MPDGQPTLTDQSDGHGERSARRSMLRGWRRKCPSCGTGPMFKGFLSVRARCTVCGQELMHHRADDGPAYLTILVTGHLLMPLMFPVVYNLRPDPLVMATVFCTAAVIITLYLLPRIKGAIVGLQWAKRMYGFAGD